MRMMLFPEERLHRMDAREMRSDMLWLAVLAAIVLVGLLGWLLGFLDVGGGYLPLG